VAAYEFSVAFECDSEDEAEDVMEAVLLATCGGKRWKHRWPLRWLARWLPIDVCPRSFAGSGPYELDEEGEPRYDAGRRYFERPKPLYTGWSSNTGNTFTTNWSGTS
jgi:hypothetical protein